MKLYKLEGKYIKPEKLFQFFLKEDKTGKEALDFESFARAYIKVLTIFQPEMRPYSCSPWLKRRA